MNVDQLRGQYLGAVNEGRPLGWRVWLPFGWHLRIWRGGFEIGESWGGSICRWRHVWLLPWIIIKRPWRNVGRPPT